MTVEQPALPRYEQTKQNDDHTYAQVKEITGITDKTKIHEAINACRNNDGKYDMHEVVNKLLLEDNSSTQKQKKSDMAITYPKDTKDSVDALAGNQAQSNDNKIPKVVDLTSDSNESEDIQKAIAASLQDSVGGSVQETSGILGGQVSREEQDISRVLEQSLIESKAGTKRKRGDIWFVDPLNPHERKRHENWPVGLKNVGNTCWFSAVIQSLLLLRRFRHLVLHYKADKDLNQASIQERRNLRFMQELRHLFALMIGTKRKYVDPSKAVDILKEAFSTHNANNTGVTDSQQDVSEFQHKLLEWLEDAFKSDSSPSSPEQQPNDSTEKSRISKNPMADLFYGQFRADGINEGKGFSKEENFGQFPLQVEGFRDIHESLEAATAHREIESINSDSTQKSGQELWFTRLPPVLTFELSRFQFSQQLGRPEKIHHKIEFPQIIYMDRYMDCNREETRRRREQAKKLKEELAFLQAKLDKFINYGSGVKRFPLQDVLLYALEFAKTRPEMPRRHINPPQDVDMEAPSPNTSGMVVDSPVKSPPDIARTRITSPTPKQPSPDKTQSTTPSVSTSPTLPIPDVNMSPVPSSNTPPDITMATEPASRSPTLGAPLQSPYPRHISEGEMQVLQDCLHRWRTEVESDVRELQENISGLEGSINQMYGDEEMRKHAYHLHAVLVHEGQAASGHYWAYVFDITKDKWLKFNDITVTEATWEELEKESVGGYHNASAYCLMYINKGCFTSDTGEQEDKMQTDLESLPNDLHEVVQDDNKLFHDEIDKWDKDQARKAMGGGDSSVTVIEDTKTVKPAAQAGNSSTVSTQTPQPTKTVNIAAVHAHISFNESLAALKIATESEAFSKNIEEAINFAMNSEYKRIQSIVNKLPSSFPILDPRLQHIVTFIVHCRCSEDVLKVVLLEQFSEIMWESNEKVARLKNLAKQIVKQLMMEGGDSFAKRHAYWHETYQMYRKTVAMFIKGVNVYLDEKYEIALPYLVHSHLLSEELRKKRQKNAGLPEPKISAFFLRQCLLHINDTITQTFEDHFEVTDLLQQMTTLVLPCLQVLAQSEYQDDVSAVEEIRGKWCSFLGKDIEGVKIEQLQDFLSKLFEPPLDLLLPKVPNMRNESFQNFHKQYEDVMKLVSEYGYLDRALKGS